MMNTYVANAFSLQMLGECPRPASITVTAITAETARNELLEGGEWISAVGHPDTAAVMTEQLRLFVLHNRININLHAGDRLYVGQIVGGRLPEGCTSLPEGVRIEWRRVDVVDA